MRTPVTSSGSLPGFLSLILAIALIPHPAPGKDRRNDLLNELRAAISARDWPKATGAARDLVALDPKEPGGWYDLACMQAQGGETAAAVESLRASATRGFDRVATLARDQDLDPIRSSPGFAEVQQAIRANNERSVAEFSKRARREAEVRVIAGSGVRAKVPAPLIIALHGRGGDAASFAATFAPVAGQLGAVLVVPQGMEKVGAGFGWGKVEEGEQMVLLAMERAHKAHLIDPARVVVVGFSQGGAASIAFGLRYPTKVSGVVALASGDDPRVYIVPELPRHTIPRYALVVGGEDPEQQETRPLARRLESEGVRVKLHVEPGLGHAVPHAPVLLDAIRFAFGVPD